MPSLRYLKGMAFFCAKQNYKKMQKNLKKLLTSKNKSDNIAFVAEKVRKKSTAQKCNCKAVP